MARHSTGAKLKLQIGLILFASIQLAGCGLGKSAASPDLANQPDAVASAELILSLHDLGAVDPNALPLNVVATTSMIGDVARQVGGDLVDLQVLIAPGQDPHSYTPTARALSAVEQADVILINGWNLEQGLIEVLGQVALSAPLVPVSAGIEPRLFEQGDGSAAGLDGEADAHTDHTVDPHVWMNIINVAQWTENIALVYSMLDPGNSPSFESRAADYQAQLAELEVEFMHRISELPPERRLLVTNHEALGYFADHYGFDIVGTVHSGGSTLAEPSAADLAALVAKMQAARICELFTDAGGADNLARTIAAELDTCDDVELLPLYTGGLGPAGTEADSYIGMMHANLDSILAALE